MKKKTTYQLKKLAVQPLVKINRFYNYLGRKREIAGRRVKAVRPEKHSGGIWVEYNGEEYVVSPFQILGIDARTFVVAHR